MGLAEVPEDAEEMYDSYNRTYKEIQEKVAQVQEDRRQVMTEIEERTRKWSDVIHNLLDEVNARYQSLLSRLQARGEVRLINPSDIEEAGLEIFVSFKGGQLVASTRTPTAEARGAQPSWPSSSPFSRTS